MNKRYIITLFLLLLAVVLSAQTSTENYVRVRTYLSTDGSQYRDDIVYYDALGRDVQHVQAGGSPNGGDLVTLKEYDGLGRLYKVWCSAAVSSNNGCYVDVSALQDRAILSNGSDSEPYSQTSYEASPSDRVLKQYGPGSDWHQRDKGISTSYLLNNGYEPRLYCMRYTAVQEGLRIFVTSHGGWPDGSLTVTCTRDEDGHTTYEFRDMEDHLVLLRQQADEGFADTYYIRDEWGHLQAVLPPQASSLMTATGAEWNSDEPELSQYGYVYIYDRRYRQVAKRLPGCAWIYTVYDRSDTPVFTQDGNMRRQGLWHYVLSDSWGRPCQTGTCTNLFSIFGSPLEDAVVAVRSASGYTAEGVTLENAVVLTENYYDHYGNIPADSFAYESGTGYGERDGGNPVGKVTATRTRILDDSGTSLFSKTFYDYRGRAVQTKSTNYLGGTETDYASYDFTGNVIARKHIHTAPGQSSRTERYTYEYDLWGRMTQETHQLGAAVNVVINRNTYDALGRLRRASHGNLPNATMTYAYNVRSWLTAISSPLFSQQLYYNVPENGSTPCYSGNVSRMTWRTGSTASQGVQQSYAYSYDRQNRLSSATYTQNGTECGYYDVFLQYDANGNVTLIDRYDRDIDGRRIKADEVTLRYNGNQLYCLDAFDPYVGHNAHIPFNGHSAVEFAYDSNGNLTKDVHRNVTSVEYNMLNLPRQINFGDGNVIRYTYDATGRKLRVEYGTQGYTLSQPQTARMEQQSELQTDVLTVSSTTDYVGNYVYSNGLPWYLTLDCGEVSLAGAFKASSYCYDLKDYQGTVRMAVRSGSSTHFMADYYPYGGMIRKGKIDTHHRLFISKELDKMHGLNWYDFGARMYDPLLGRFTTVDPLAELYYPFSPYTYCLNNPIKFLDKNGQAPGDFFVTVDDAAKDFGFFYNDNSIRQNKEFAAYIFEIKDEQGNKGYSYSMASVGNEKSSMPVMEFGAKNVATIHTHASYNNKYGMGNNLFSGSFSKDGELLTNEQKRTLKTTNNDVGNANMREMNSYVATPNGSLQKYSPSTGRTTIISNEMPSDTNDPDRLNKIGIQETNPITLPKSLIMQQNIYKGILNNNIK